MQGPRALPISVGSREETGINSNKRINKMLATPIRDSADEIADALDELAANFRSGRFVLNSSTQNYAVSRDSVSTLLEIEYVDTFKQEGRLP